MFADGVNSEWEQSGSERALQELTLVEKERLKFGDKDPFKKYQQGLEQARREISEHDEVNKKLQEDLENRTRLGCVTKTEKEMTRSLIEANKKMIGIIRDRGQRLKENWRKCLENF